MDQRSPIVVTIVKKSKRSKHLINEIRQIIYVLNQGNNITKMSIKYNEFNKDIKQKWMLNLQILKVVKTFDPHRLLLNLTDKINLQKSDQQMALSKLSIYYTKLYNNQKHKILEPTWNEEFESPDGSYSI